MTIPWKSIKLQINLFLAAFSVFIFFRDPSTALALAFFWPLLFSVLAEGAFLYFKTKKFKVTDSALTTGLITGCVLWAGSPWWMFLAVTIVAIASKYVLKFRGKNIFNPASLGLFLAVLCLKGATEWKGAYAWYILLPAGLYIVHKIRKMEIVLGYVSMSLLLFIPQAIAQGAPLWDIPGYFNYFFLFIMLIEPKTTPPTRWPKLLFGAGVALLVFLLTEWSFRYEPELAALLVLNALVPLLNKVPNFKFPAFQKNPKGATP